MGTRMVEALIAAGCDVNLVRNNGLALVFIAAYKGHTVVVETLARCDFNRATNDGATPELVAAQEWHTVVVEAIVAAGYDVNQADNDGTTPLITDVYYDNHEIVVALLKHGADAALATSETVDDVAAGSTARSRASLVTARWCSC